MLGGFRNGGRQMAPSFGVGSRRPEASSGAGELVTDGRKLDDNVGELSVLDRNLVAEFERNMAAKRAAQERRLKEKKKNKKSPETCHEHWIAFKYLVTFKNGFLVAVFLIFVGLFLWLIFKEAGTAAPSTCGGYISATTTGTISTLNYPGNYDNNMLCIWLLEAPSNYYITLTFPQLDLEGTSSSGCLDFLEIREGSSVSTLLYYNCNETTSQTVNSTSPWMWIRVKSNDANTFTGFEATWRSVEGGSGDQTSPILACPWTHFQCSNMECVSWSWVCDNWNDCGCTSGCDEDGCGGFNYAFTTLLAIGMGTGGIVFIVIIVVIVNWENYQKRKAKRKEEERQKEAAARKRKQHNMKAVIKTAEAISGRQAPTIKVTQDKEVTAATAAAKETKTSK